MASKNWQFYHSNLEWLTVIFQLKIPRDGFPRQQEGPQRLGKFFDEIWVCRFDFVADTRSCKVVACSSRPCTPTCGRS